MYKLFIKYDRRTVAYINLSYEDCISLLVSHNIKSNFTIKEIRK